MSSMTNYLEGLIGDHLFRTATWAKFTNLCVGLLTAVSDGEAQTVTEVSGGSYARVQRNPDDANWDAPVSNNKTFKNTAQVAFPSPTASWGTVTHFGLFDSLNGGQLLAYAPLATARTIDSNSPAPVFDAGTLRFIFSGSITDHLVGQIGDHFFRTATFAKPAALCVGMKVGSTEVSGGAYSRLSRAPLDANWDGPASGNGVFKNAAALTWAVPTANWGAVDKVSIFDAATLGNEWFTISITALSINNGDPAPNIAAGGLTMTLN